MIIRNILKSLKTPCNYQVLRQYADSDIPRALRSLKPKSTRETVQYYIDSTRIRAVAGNGGDGCISFLSVWCKEQAGPDGGDGGHGGHVIFQATHSVKSLNHCRKVVQAEHGGRGDNKNRHGKNADHVVIPVPLGTIVKDANDCVVGELAHEGAMFVAARGGAGGRGNRFFLTDTEQAPSVAQLGGQGECIRYEVSMRARALAALVGAPSAGKSSLLRAVSRARPKAHAAPFTTRRPHIGMIPYDDHEQVALADLPGLIEGSHQNRGLGIQFLQHVERCHGFIYLLDGASDPVGQYEMLTNELFQYSPELLHRPHCIVVNKIDLEEVRDNLEDYIEELEEIVKERGGVEYNVVGISALTGENLGELLRIIRVMHDKAVSVEVLSEK